MTLIMKRIIGAALALVIGLSLIPQIAVPVQAETTGLSIEQLRQKFPHGKYWNHADNPGASNAVNNQDGYSSTPCSRHGVIGTDRQTCNGFQPGDRQLSWQCMGYAEKLGYDATGRNPRDSASGWYIDRSLSALDNLKPGDIVRYRYDGHSIYITAVEGDTVTYTDCNSDGRCVIQWDATVSMASLRSSFTYVHVAPSSQTPGPAVCDCSEEYAGTYICTTANTDLNIRSGHGSSYRIIGSIPRGATVIVSKASGIGDSDWAHITYNGVTGFASMQYLSPKPENQERDSRMAIWMSDRAMGESIETIRTGQQLYLCYKIYDANTGDLFDSYNTNGEYTAKLTLYEPDGSVAQTYTYTNDNNCISITGTTPGRYKGELVFTWDSGGTAVTTADIDMVYEPQVIPSAADIRLNTEGANSQTITVSYSGATKSDSVYLDCTTTGDCFTYSWGNWSGNTMPLTITGVRAGEGIITIELYDADTDELLATADVSVTVTAPAEEPQVQWVQATTTLGGNIGLNFYVKLSDSLVNDSSTVMHFEFDGRSIDVPLAKADKITVGGEIQYRFTCLVNAKNMTDTISAQIATSAGPVGAGRSLSVATYCNYMINNSDDAELVSLMKAMLNYGTAAQILFDHNTDTLANAGLSEADRQLADVDATPYAHSHTGSEAGVQVTNATLILETETTVRIYFKLTGSKTIEQYICKVDGVVVTPQASGSEYFLEIPDIAAQNLDVMHTVTIGGITVTYGGLSYVNQVLGYSGSSEVLTNTVKALFTYNKMAELYFN